LSEDPMGFGAGDSNMFRYCGGDPVNSIDPFGLLEHGGHGQGPYVPTKKDGNDLGNAINNALPGYEPNGSSYGRSGGAEVWLGDSTIWGPGNTGVGNGRGGTGPGTIGLGPSGTISGSSNGPGDGSGPGAGGSGSARNSSSNGPLYSGGIPVRGWPQWLTFSEMGPTDPATKAWTKSGLYPTLIYGGFVFAPVLIPELIVPVGAGTWHFMTRTAPYWWALFRFRELASDPTSAEPPPPPPSVVEPAPPRIGRPSIPWQTPPPQW
jgi:hypothetical protein